MDTATVDSCACTLLSAWDVFWQVRQHQQRFNKYSGKWAQRFSHSVEIWAGTMNEKWFVTLCEKKKILARGLYSNTHLPLLDSWLGGGTLVCAVNNNSYVWSSSSSSASSPLSSALLFVNRACTGRIKWAEPWKKKKWFKGPACKME